jgi:hypothetical protein
MAAIANAAEVSFDTQTFRQMLADEASLTGADEDVDGT